MFCWGRSDIFVKKDLANYFKFNFKFKLCGFSVSKQFKTTSLLLSPQQYKQLLKHCENEKNGYSKNHHILELSILWSIERSKSVISWFTSV